MGSLPVNIDDIRQIEVVKGPSSALFGSNAAGGVVNIITTNPLYDNLNVAQVSVGTDGYTSGDATATYKTGTFGGLKMSAGGLAADEFNTGRYTNENATKTNPQKRYLMGTGNFQVNSKVQANTEFTYSEGQNTEAAFTHNLFGQKFLTYSARAGFSWDTPYGTISNNNYFNHTRAALKLSDYVTTFAMNTDLFVSQLEDQFKIGADHTIRLALEYRNKGFDIEHPSLAANPQDPKIAEDSYAAGATWLWNMTDNLSWTNALRMDHLKIREDGTLPATDPLENSDYSHSINTLSANSGLSYKPTDNDTLRVTYGRGIQMPSLIQTGWSIDLSEPSFLLDMVGNPDLKPTIVQNYEIGYDRKIARLSSVFSFSTFYQLNQDIATAVTSGALTIGGTPAYQAKAANVGNSHGWGIETGLKGNHKNFRWDGSYSYARVSDAESVATYLNFRGSAPVHQFRLMGGYTMGKWEFDANGRYVSATDMFRRSSALAYQRESANGYISLGGRIGYSINDNFVVAATGSQLNQSRLSATAYPALERQMMLSFTGHF